MQFPLQLLHSDKPDFVLSVAGAETVIEHTEVVPENVAHANFLREKGHGPEMYFIPHASPGEPNKSGAEIIQEIKADEMGGGLAMVAAVTSREALSFRCAGRAG